MISVVDAPLALRWLGLARRAFLASQAVFVVLAAWADPGVAMLPWLAGLALAALVDAAAPKGEGDAAVRRHAAVDLIGIAAVLMASGGAENPVGSFLLVELALLAVVLPPRESWVAAAVTLVLYALTVFFCVPLHGLDDEPHEHIVHLVGHVLAFDVAAVAITALVGRLSATVRAREEALRTVLVRQADNERLAALGSLAVGTAHSLGTPLGAIELLAEEMALELPSGAPGRDAWTALRGEVARSRAILDHLLSGDAGQGGATHSIGSSVESWIQGWRQGHGAAKVRVDVDDEVGQTAVRGGESGWRGALWTVLDNAVRAGGEDGRIEVRLRRDEATVLVEVLDEGPVLEPESLVRAGEPFHSGWPDRSGNGLGLFAARRFARGAGGDLWIVPGLPRGARVTLQMRVEGR